jgi:hypothetical protein
MALLDCISYRYVVIANDLNIIIKVGGNDIGRVESVSVPRTRKSGNLTAFAAMMDFLD